MSSPNEVTTGANVKLYKGDEITGTLDVAAVAAIAVEENLVGRRLGGSAIGNTRNYIEQAYTDFDVPDYLPDNRSVAEVTVDLGFKWDEAIHTAIRDDDGTAKSSFVIAFADPNDPDAITYAHCNGYIAGTTMPLAGIGEAVNATLTIKPTTIWSYFDAA